MIVFLIQGLSSIVGIFVITFLIFLCNRYIRIIKSIFIDKTLLIFTCLLIITLCSFFVALFTTDQKSIIKPSIILIQRVGQDLFDGTIKGSYSILEGKKFDSVGYGISFTAVFSLFILFLRNFNLCLPHREIQCVQTVYPYYVSIVFLGYILSLWKFIRVKNQVYLAIIFFVMFMLGTIGMFGTSVGNLDILFALIITIYLFLFPYYKTNQIFNFFSGFIFAMLVNSKFFLLPYLFVILLISDYPLITLGGVILNIGFNYVIPLFFGLSITPLLSLTAALNFGNKTQNGIYIICLSFNHSVFAISSLFLNCMKNGFSIRRLLNPFYLLSVLLIIFFIFVYPYKKFPIYIIKKNKIIRLWLKVIQSKYKIEFQLFLFILVTLLINILPTLSFDYRVFYSLPIIFSLLVDQRIKDKSNLYYSLFFLSMKGLWVFTRLYQRGFMPFDPRGMNIFLILHYYFLTKAILVYFESVLLKTKKSSFTRFEPHLS